MGRAGVTGPPISSQFFLIIKLYASASLVRDSRHRAGPPPVWVTRSPQMSDRVSVDKELIEREAAGRRVRDARREPDIRAERYATIPPD